MDDAEYVRRVDAFLNEMFPQLKHCSVDIGNLNELAMETTRRMKAINGEQDHG